MLCPEQAGFVADVLMFDPINQSIREVAYWIKRGSLSNEEIPHSIFSRNEPN
jgi:hypothetical protein